jgi:ribosomal protein L11 methyltransferase
MRVKKRIRKGRIMDQAEWTKLTVKTGRDDLETVSAIMSMLDNGLMIEDYSDFPLDGMYGELIDESILSADRESVSISIFVPAEKSLGDAVAFLRERLAALGIEHEVLLEGLREEDWAESWKKYYHPIPLGRITVVPAWQEYEAREGELVVRMDPGMAFGAGTHETTRLAILLLGEEIRGGESVLDIGCGSGILSIAAATLGATECRAYDIDPVAVRVAAENVAASGVGHIVCGVSDLLRSAEQRDGGYDIAVANIVSDILLRLAPDVGTYLHAGSAYIVSGIIAPRLDEVREAMRAEGFAEEKIISENDWYAVRFRKC